MPCSESGLAPSKVKVTRLRSMALADGEGGVRWEGVVTTDGGAFFASARAAARVPFRRGRSLLDGELHVGDHVAMHRQVPTLVDDFFAGRAVP